MTIEEELGLAVELGDAAQVRALIPRYSSEMIEGFTLLSTVLMSDLRTNVSLIHELIEQPSVHLLNADGTSALYWAVASGDESIVQPLLEKNLSVNAESRTELPSSLHRAAEDGHRDLLALLLRRDFDRYLNSFDYISRTPLMCAAEAGSLECARLLLEAGADVNAHDEARSGDSALRMAVKKKQPQMVRLLLDHRADPDLKGWMWITPRMDAEKLKRGPEAIAIRKMFGL